MICCLSDIGVTCSKTWNDKSKFQDNGYLRWESGEDHTGDPSVGSVGLQVFILFCVLTYVCLLDTLD